MTPTFQTSDQQRTCRPRVLWLWLALALFSYALPASAQHVVSNGFVEADVDDNQGLVTVYYAPKGAHTTSIVHAAQTSYLTVLINGNLYYTNNQHLPLNGVGNFPANTPAGYLEGGKTKYTGPNKDTIETIWEPQGPNTYDIIQDIYPVAFANSGQIVYRFSVRNYQNKPLSAQAEYLLDVDLGIIGHGNDAAPITTKFGYLTTNVTSYPPTNSVPPYFIATLQPLDSANFPLLIAEGYFDPTYSPEPLPLIAPVLLAYVQWPDVVQNWTWGFPTTSPVVNDEALLMQWVANGADSGQAPQVLGCFSYGSAACEPICFGNLNAMMIHPDHIVWDPNIPPAGGYVPNHFPVDGIVWNANLQTATTASGTQSIIPSFPTTAPGPVQITTPTPVTGGGYIQNHGLSNSSTIPGRSSSSISWVDTVLQSPSSLLNCSTDSMYDIAFSVLAGGVGNTVCQNGSPYVCPIKVDCELKDVTAPRHTAHLTVGAVNSCGLPKAYRDSVYDNSISDQGVQSITWNATPNNSAVQVTIGAFTACANTKIPITVTQVDTVQAPCAYFTFTDCANNVSYDTVCFSRCLPPVPFDTLPPHFRLLSRYNQNYRDSTNATCEYQCSEWVVTDSVEESLPGLQRDGGLSSITALDPANMTLTLLHPVTRGMKADTFTVCVNDSMSLQGGSILIVAIDSIGNTDTLNAIDYCTIPDTKAPIITVITQSTGWAVHVSDTQAWDRGVDSILLTAVQNCIVVPNPGVITIDNLGDSTWSIHPVVSCSRSNDFAIEIIDTFKKACFTLQASDCARNLSSAQTYCTNGKSDLFCPSDDTIHLGGDSLMVVFSDFHTGIDYDEGIDSIWITSVHNMSMIHGSNVYNLSIPFAIHEPPTGKDPPKFQIFDTVIFFVTDTTVHDTVPASVCWNAIDGSTANNNNGGNALCNNNVQCWSYALVQDTTPAYVTLGYEPCDSLTVNVTDVRTNDRGIYRVWDTELVNLSPFSEIDPGATSLSFDLGVLDRTKSATGKVLASDVWGTQSQVPGVQALHTTALDLAVYRQDLAMMGSGIVRTTANAGVTFNVPVYLTATDSFPLAQKNITQYQFQFHITGSNLLNFLGTAIPPTMPAGWTITPAPGSGPGAGPPYTISGIGPALTNLNATDTLVYLVFNGAKSPDVEEAQIVPNPNNCGDEVQFNGGKDTAYSTLNYTVTLPAPAGLLNGGDVVFMDTCATIVGNNPHPTILSIAPAIPNPFTGSTVVQYTVPTEAPVRLELFDALGQKMRTLIEGTQKQGTYQITMDGNSLQGGVYFLRLESAEQICSERVILTK